MAGVENRLIELLPRKERRNLLAICEPVALALSDVLSEKGKRTRHVYFPVSATISLVTPIDGKPCWKSAWSAGKAWSAPTSSWG